MACDLCRFSPTGECEFCRMRKEIYSSKKLDIPLVYLPESKSSQRGKYNREDNSLYVLDFKIGKVKGYNASADNYSKKSGEKYAA